MPLNPNTKKLIEDRLNQFESTQPKQLNLPINVDLNRLSVRDVIGSEPISTPQKFEDFSGYIPGVIDPVYGDESTSTI